MIRAPTVTIMHCQAQGTRLDTEKVRCIIIVSRRSALTRTGQNEWHRHQKSKQSSNTFQKLSPNVCGLCVDTSTKASADLDCSYKTSPPSCGDDVHAQSIDCAQYFFRHFVVRKLIDFTERNHAFASKVGQSKSLQCTVLKR